MRRAQFRVVLLATVLVAAACNRGLDNSLLGTWHQVGGPDTITFLQDGSFSATMGGGFSGTGKFELNGTYFLEGDKLSLTYKNGSESMTCSVKFDGDTMTIAYDQGASVKMDRSMARFKRAR